MNTIVLEPSTNTHRLNSESEIRVEDLGAGILKINTGGIGVVTHGEHGTLCTESEHVIKYVQQEFNPLTKKLQNAYD
jgi:hypothetical protein